MGNEHVVKRLFRLVTVVTLGLCLVSCSSLNKKKTLADYALEIRNVFDPTMKVAYYFPKYEQNAEDMQVINEKGRFDGVIATDNTALEVSVRETLSQTFEQWDKFGANTRQHVIIKIAGMGYKSIKQPNYVALVKVQLLSGTGKILSEANEENVLIHDKFNDYGALKKSFRIAFSKSLLKAKEKLNFQLTAQTFPLGSINMDMSLVSDGAKSHGISNIGNGTGFYVNQFGHVITNHHVVDGCIAIRVIDHSGKVIRADLVSSDSSADLAILQSHARAQHYIPLSRQPAKLGEDVFTLGYPVQSLLSKNVSLTSGVISSLAGLHDDKRMMQISVPIQPGNSGGPLVSMAGNLVGVVVATINTDAFLQHSGTLPQNINFALTGSTLQSFLKRNRVPYEVSSDETGKALKELAGPAQEYTVKVVCQG